MRKKVTVVGAGNVGANCALRIAGKELADVVLVDVVEGVPQGKGLDMLRIRARGRIRCQHHRGQRLRATANSDIVVITAGFPRKPGMSRDDLLLANYEVVKSVTEQVGEAFAQCHPDPGNQSSGRHVLDRVPSLQISQDSRHRHGGRSGHRAFPHLYRRRTERFGEKCHRA